MRILPAERDFDRWRKCIPTQGDLVFFGSKGEATDLSVPVFTPDEVREQSLGLWKLNDRSWYGYSLNQAKFAVWFPPGAIESLDQNMRAAIAKLQVKRKVPTLIAASKLSPALSRKIPAFAKFHWLTSSVWTSLSRSEQIDCMRAWFSQNGIIAYKSIEFTAMSSSVQKELRRLKFQNILNTYCDVSGPNCFGAVAGAISAKNHLKMAKQWLHWKPLERYLEKTGYKKVNAHDPQSRDVFVFFRGKQAVHAAYYLGDQLYFEKPGQDFYEPYRVEKFDKWKKEWSGTTLSIYRKNR